MDKIAAKEMMDANGIPNPKWQKLTYTEAEIPQLAETLPMPCVVKAPTGGSSLGVYLPKDRQSWRMPCGRSAASAMRCWWSSGSTAGS